MTREVYTDREFIRFSRSQVFVRLFVDTDSQGARIARKYSVRGFPTLIVLDQTGREIDRLVGGRSARQLRSELESIFDLAGPDKEAAAPAPPPAPSRQSPPPVAAKSAPDAVPAAPPAVKAAAQSDQKPPNSDQKPPNRNTSPEVNKAADEDPVARLERSLAAAKDESEIKWLRLMLGIAHFQKQQWKEARAYLSQVLEKDPDNATARDIMKSLEGK